MIRSRRRAARALAIAGAAFVPARALLAAEVCPRSCAQEELGCTIRAAACEAKIRAFGVYAQQIDSGQPRYPLAPIYGEILRAHYPDADFEKVRIAFSDQQPPDNATTFCNDIYFNDASYVAALRDAAPNHKWAWLLHELTHVEQCNQGGGRERYALRWWSELETAVREDGATIDLFQTTEQLARQLQKLYLRVHGAMPMERAADAKAEAVLAKLRACCIAADGTPVRPAP